MSVSTAVPYFTRVRRFMADEWLSMGRSAIGSVLADAVAAGVDPQDRLALTAFLANHPRSGSHFRNALQALEGYWAAKNTSQVRGAD